MNDDFSLETDNNRHIQVGAANVNWSLHVPGPAVEPGRLRGSTFSHQRRLPQLSCWKPSPQVFLVQDGSFRWLKPSWSYNSGFLMQVASEFILRSWDQPHPLRSHLISPLA